VSMTAREEFIRDAVVYTIQLNDRPNDSFTLGALDPDNSERSARRAVTDLAHPRPVPNG
jgi:hypothetical protein